MVIEARRLIIERCLYGVDINPLAVEMAKLSLWRVSMLPAPFTFVEDKLACGDSLLGITDLRQLEWMHLDPRRGRALHENRPWAFNRSAREVAAEIFGLREQISWLSDSSEDYAIKRKLLADARDKGSYASKLANLVVAARLAEAARGRKKYNPNMIAADLARIAASRPDKGWDRVTKQAWEWLNTDRVLGSFSRSPIHWPLAFPEVFLEKGGFDAIIGNPPFLGGQKLTGALGPAYREYLVQSIGHGLRGSADLVAYFVLRAHRLLNSTGQVGLLATNTLAQGDTREVSLDQITANGVMIRKAVKTRRGHHVAPYWNTARSGQAARHSRMRRRASLTGSRFVASRPRWTLASLVVCTNWQRTPGFRSRDRSFWASVSRWSLTKLRT